MALILNIESTTDVCSVAIAKDGATWAMRQLKDKNIHAKKLTIFIEQVFQDVNRKIAELDAVAVSEGPGSYTGLRIGLSTAKGLCYGLNKPLIAVPTLRALAEEGFWYYTESGTHLIALQDARRMDAYVAIYKSSGEEILAPTFLTLEKNTFDDYLPDLARRVVVGNAAFKLKGLIDKRYDWHFPNIECSAKHFAALAEQAYQAEQFVDLAYFEPFYLKKPHITRPKSRL